MRTCTTKNTQSKFDYNYFRDYDPSTGRYIESDPIGLRGGLTTFAYASNSALARSDPLGLTDIYIGGARDSTDLVVRDYAASNGGQYFEWWDGHGVLDAISKASKNEPLNVVGHSLGGATAALAAIQSDRRIDNLITVDPVSREMACYLGKNADRWINVRAGHASGMDRSDWIAWAGGKWGGSPARNGAEHWTSPANHWDFPGMMQKPGPSGLSPREIVVQSYGPTGE